MENNSFFKSIESVYNGQITKEFLYSLKFIPAILLFTAKGNDCTQYGGSFLE